MSVKPKAKIVSHPVESSLYRYVTSKSLGPRPRFSRTFRNFSEFPRIQSFVGNENLSGAN